MNSSATDAKGEYLTFRLDAEEYAFDILDIQEIRSYEPPTRMAGAPDYVKGVINLRGVIVPIVDLRLKLQCARADFDSFTVVVVLNLADRVVGAVVDSVSEVVELGAESIQPPPSLAAGDADAYVRGIGTLAEASGTRTILLLDAEALLGKLVSELEG